MTQRPSDENISQPGDFNGSQWWWCGTKTKGKCEPPNNRYHNPSSCKGNVSRRLPKKEDNKVTIQAAINKSKGGEYESE